MVKDPALIDMVRRAVQSIGVYRLTLDKVKRAIANMGHQRIPCTDTIWKIMRNHFGLTYKMRCAANIRYSDDKFYDKRLWVSRLLAQFMHDEVVILSIDECSFQGVSDFRQWQVRYTGIFKVDDRCRRLFENVDRRQQSNTEGDEAQKNEGTGNVFNTPVSTQKMMNSNNQQLSTDHAQVSSIGLTPLQQ